MAESHFALFAHGPSLPNLNELMEGAALGDCHCLFEIGLTYLSGIGLPQVNFIKKFFF